MLRQTLMIWMMTNYLRFKELTLNTQEEAILISWRLRQFYEGMVLDSRCLQDIEDAILMLQKLAKGAK